MRMMVSSSLSDISFYVIPLLDDNINIQDVSENSGFIGAYSEDINRPYLEDKIFLMYDSTVNTLESMNRFLKFSKLDTIHNTRYIVIKGKHYIVYTFNIVHKIKDIKGLLAGNFSLSTEAKIEISNFWRNCELDDLVLALLLPHFRSAKDIKKVLPEEDYYPYESFADL